MSHKLLGRGRAQGPNFSSPQRTLNINHRRADFVNGKGLPSFTSEVVLLGSYLAGVNWCLAVAQKDVSYVLDYVDSSRHGTTSPSVKGPSCHQVVYLVRWPFA